jgi:hypothetical protein
LILDNFKKQFNNVYENGIYIDFKRWLAYDKILEPKTNELYLSESNLKDKENTFQDYSNKLMGFNLSKEIDVCRKLFRNILDIISQYYQ